MSLSTATTETDRLVVAGTPLLVSAAALINQRHKVLIAQRPETKTWPGKWELPGGKIEAGETPRAALVRELHEELAILVDPSDLKPLTFISHTYPEFAVLIPIFLCRRWSGTVQGAENQTLTWMSPHDAASYDWLPSNTEVMEHLALFLELYR